MVGLGGDSEQNSRRQISKLRKGQVLKSFFDLEKILQAYGSDLAGQYLLCHRLGVIHLAGNRYRRSLGFSCVKSGRSTNIYCMSRNLLLIS